MVRDLHGVPMSKVLPEADPDIFSRGDHYTCEVNTFGNEFVK